MPDLEVRGTREAAKSRRNVAEIAAMVVDTALRLHRDLGPGLLESVYEAIHPVHPKQLLTYLRLMNLPLGLLINFGAPLLKDGLKRVVNRHTNFASSRLHVHREGFES